MPEHPFPSPPSPRQRRILDAALALFGRYGFRRTSMDAIAAEVPVAKATIYANFGSKEQLFVAVTQYLCDGFVADSLAVAADPAFVDAHARVHALLVAKHTRMFEHVHQHPHAAELIASKNALANEIVARADATFRDVLVGVLADAGSADPDTLADVLHWTALGISRVARDADDHRARLGIAVATILGTAPPSSRG